MAVSFVFALRYYFLLSFNILGRASGNIFTLPVVLRRILYIKLIVICILCVLLYGAVMAVRAEWSIAICLIMSGLTLAT